MTSADLDTACPRLCLSARSRENHGVSELCTKKWLQMPVKLPGELEAALLQVPLYSAFIKERFERCLDLYLAPRARQMRLHVPYPEALLPQLPQPRDLQPFPTTLLLKYLGHVGKVQMALLDAFHMILLRQMHISG